MKSDLERAREAMFERWPGYAEQSWSERFAELNKRFGELERQVSMLAFAKSECATRDAEIERLRGALEEIAALPGEINPSNYGPDDVCILNGSFVETYRIARAALSNKDAG